MRFCWTTGLLLWTLLKTVSPEEEEDIAVLCVFNQSCILPCSFQSSSEEVIHWFKVTAKGLNVHSFYNNQDQLEQQNQNYRNRTSLFRDQISRGNASLLLTGVKVQDEGRYRCFISTILQNNESSINLTVDAPVSKVHIHQLDNVITCSSEGIYPEPELTWSTIPPSSRTLQSRTTVHQTEEQLYNISSSLLVPDGGSDLIYSCSVTNKINMKTATIRQLNGDVFCVFMETCIMPCSFQSAGEDIIHWFQGPGRDLRVHSFYDNQDQLGHQNQNFRNRTSLFRDQISSGNASLLLRGVKVQDEATYECFISTINGNTNSFLILKVDSPITKVNLHQVENRMSCSSEGIYPEPKLTWSTIPPSNWTLQNRTTVHQTEEQLYSISSSLLVPDGGSDLIYSCTVRTRRNWRRTSFRKLRPISVSSRLVTIPCSAANSSIIFSLIWRFNLNQVIINQTRTNVTVTEEWRKHVKEVSESGSLTLQDLSSKHQGAYTCEVSDEEETNITDILLKVEEGGHADVAGIVSGVVVSFLLSAALISVFLWFYKKRRGQQGSSHEMTSRESAEAFPTER